MAAFSALVVTIVCLISFFGPTSISSDSGVQSKISNLGSNEMVSNMPLGGKSPIDGSPTLKFFYCYSCGYQKAFDHYSIILGDKYPELHIVGANYNPSILNLIGAKVLSVLKMLFIVAIISGVNYFQYIGKRQPNWWSWCIENKIYACLVVFFGSNMLEGMLISTGAFELLFNDIPVWSKLETGRIPQPAELFQIIDNYLLFDGPYPS